MYESDITQVEQRLEEIKIELQQQGADIVALQNESNYLNEKLKFLKKQQLKEFLIEEYYKAKEAMEKAQKNLEEAGLQIEKDSEKLKQSIAISKSKPSDKIILYGVAGAMIVYFLYSIRKGKK